MKRTVCGILAHVDAGKTTLSEGLLYSAGVIQSLGRVDKRNAFLDTYSLERERGITIFSKQAILELPESQITLIDTPGHIDFSCETERALSVQDYAILVISASDGIQSHTKTLWQLLSSHKIPVFIFVNKTDISDKTRRELMAEIKSHLSERCCDFSTEADFYESAASTDEALMAEYFDTGSLSDVSIRNSVRKRHIFPCYFGSALKLIGVSDFLRGFDRFTDEIHYSERLFGARVFKIAGDPQGKRLTYMKVTGKRLCLKDTLELKLQDGGTVNEKVEEIRIYSGEKFKSVREVPAGSVCAVVGLNNTFAGMGLGVEKNREGVLSPVLDYTLILPKDSDEYQTYLKLLTLTEEDPSLALSYDTKLREIRIRLMGEIQLEVIKRMILERFGIEVSFGEGKILYKETLKNATRGAGHFEPLRHYAEVHLLLEPLPEGSGIVCEADCSTDLLALNWQRLVLTHLEEKVHRGVLTGSPITDIKITLTAGKAHIKHTVGGDFRQATYRAVRQALMKAESVLLEPTFDFEIELPTENLGRAMTDITGMHGKCEPISVGESVSVLSGSCPVRTMRSYATELRAYTRGEGKLTATVGAYVPAFEPESIISEIGYDPMLDERNTPNSVFCKAGSGYVVPWNEADELMHLSPDEGNTDRLYTERAFKAQRVSYRGTAEEDKELMRIFESTYGKIKPRKITERTENCAESDGEKKKKPPKLKPRGEDYIIIDGYNFIFAVDDFRKIADSDISLARDTLTRLMCDYAAFRKCKVIIVFDAYRRAGGEGSREEVGEVTVIYTKEAETADAYIEKATHDMAKEHRVRVVTSDKEEQQIVLGSGGLRVSAREFFLEMNMTAKEIKEALDSLK